MFNLSALLASDCGLPDLARSWCHRLAGAALDNDRDPRHGLEPVVNLARLHVRAGNGTAAWTLLETLFRAIDTRTDTVIDGLTIQASRVSDAPGVHAKVRSWLWKVLLGTGAHALAVDGRWEEARHRLIEYKGFGNRMLDGRQITVIAHAVSGRHHRARIVVDTTHPGDGWENAVTACLSMLVAADGVPADLVHTDLSSYLDLGPSENGLVVFHIRLGLTLLDALGADHPAAEQIAAGLIHHAARDGYAARDVLAHPGCLSMATHQQNRQLAAFVNECGLDIGAIPEVQLTEVVAALDTAERVIAQPRERTRQPV
ncbi:hypothetical protein SAMN05421505_11034 [Sinosporangium album]|uniref:Uncharacterized protein n=1 Tax=Sinosporangium album TaxID=504805 RepID=A0A1G7YRE3_9ACTN|nr:hypothetical protein SAMN05421505_11034 [Sinosporangium album]